MTVIVTETVTVKAKATAKETATATVGEKAIVTYRGRDSDSGNY